MDDDLISEDEARAVLTPHFSLLSECLMTGWLAWEGVRATPQGGTLGKSARARIVWDHATARAEAVFGAMRDVGKVRVHGLLVLDFERLLLRFKKLDGSLRTRGIPTHQQLLFDDQGQTQADQMSLWRPVPMIIAGYVLDRLETRIERLVLVLLRHGRVVWQIDLPPATDLLATIPIRPRDDQPRPATPRSTRPKPAEGQEAE